MKGSKLNKLNFPPWRPSFIEMHPFFFFFFFFFLVMQGAKVSKCSLSPRGADASSNGEATLVTLGSNLSKCGEMK